MSNYPPQGQAGAGTASIAFSAGVSTIGNTAGITGTVSRELIFAGGNNVTLSQNIVGQTGTITVSANDIIPQYVEVAVANREFTSVKDAIDSITDASTTKPYIVKVYPGVYTESPFSMKANVSIEGTSYYNTIIQTNDNSNHFISGIARSAIRNVAIVGPTGSGKAAVYYAGTTSTPFVLQDILIRRGYYGVWANSPSLSTVHLINVNNWYTGTAMHTFIRATGYSNITAVSSGFMCGATDAVTKGFEADGPESEIYLDLCYFRNTPVTKTIVGLYVDNGGYAKLNACTFSKGTIAIQIGPNLAINGTGGNIYAASTVIRNDSMYSFNTDIKIDNTEAIMDYNGIASRSKLSILTTHFTGLFNDITTDAQGAVNLGEFYIGDLLNQLPLRDYGYTTYLTGQKSGGEVTTTGGLGVHIANGAGFINTSPTVNAVKAITWLDTNLNITANTREWIYINSAGTVTTSAINPDEDVNIILAVAYANATDVIFLSQYVRKIQHFIGKIDEEFDLGIGNIWIEDSGLDVTENATPLRLDVTTGEYFIIFNETTAVGATPITFTYWYGSDGGGWTTVTSQTDIDVINYDEAGVLTAMGTDKWKKDALYVVVNDDLSTTQYHVVYGQTLFGTQADAENGDLPTPPSFFESYSLQLAGVVVQKSTANINKIVDIRPRGHYIPPGHNTLPGLQGGNTASSQYYHLNSTEYANLSQKIIAISGSNSSVSGNTITFGNSNDLSFYITNGSVVGSFSQSLQPNVQLLNGSTGTMSISGSRNISVFNNNSTISVYGPENIVNAVSLSGNNTSGTSTLISSGTMYLAGGNNITLSQNGNSITISAFSDTVQHFSGGMSTIGNTVGTTGLVDNRLILAGGNNITLSGSTNANSMTITISAADDTITQYSAGISTLGNTVGTTGLAANRLILAGGNNITLSGSTNANSMTVTISAPNQSVQTQNLIDATIAGNTSGTKALISSGTLTLAGGNNITLSQDGNAITISAHTQSVQPAINLAASDTIYTSGTVVLSGGNNITVGTNGQTVTISAFDQSQQTQNIIRDVNIIGNTSGATTNVTSGTLSLAGGDNITLSQNGNAITISAAAVGAGSFTAGMSDLGNTAGTTGVVNNRLVFAGGNNMTISQSIDGQSATMTFNFATIGAGSFTAGISDLGNTAGTSGVVENQIVFVGGNNITLSQSIDAQSATLTISAQSQSVQTQNLIDVTLSGNTSGALALISSGTLTLAGGNNITLSQAGNAVTISAQSQSIQTQNIIQDINIIGNTSGTTAEITSGTLSIAGGNNITLSQNQNSITISGANALLAGMSDLGNTDGTSGAVYSRLIFAGGNDIILSQSVDGQSATITIDAVSDTISMFTAGMSNIGNTSGTTGLVYNRLVLAGGNNITLSQSTDGQSATITISAMEDIITQFSGGVSNLGNSAGTTGTIDNRIVFVGGTNITLSQSIGAGAASENATITINALTQSIQPGIQSLSAGTTRITTGEAIFSNSNNISFGADGQTITASIHAEQTGISSIAASDTTYTSGQVEFTGSNMVTVRSSANQRVVIDATQTVQTQNLHALALHNNTSGNTTIGTSGTVSFAGTNITITANTANNSIIGFSAADPTAAGIAAIGNTASSNAFTSGSIMFSGQANITINTSQTSNSQYIQLSVTNPGILSVFGGTTRVTSGEVVFSNANSISFGVNGNTMTASFSQSVQTQSTYSAPVLNIWQNADQALSTMATSNNRFWMVPLTPGEIFPGNMTANTALLNFSVQDGDAANAHTVTWKLGIYTINGSSLSILNSASLTWAVANNQTSLVSGERFATIHSSDWSAQPTFSQAKYYLGVIGHIAGENVNYRMFGYRILESANVRSGTMGVGLVTGNTSMGVIPWIGISGNQRASNVAMPTNIDISELSKIGGLYGFIPHLQFNNIQSNF